MDCAELTVLLPMIELTDMVMAFDVTGDPVRQACAGSFVITQVTTFPLTRVLEL